MPELPEVENTVRRLRAAVTGRSINGVEVEWPRAVAHPALAAFKRRLADMRITDVVRRGKFVIFLLADGARSRRACLVAHMRMSGSFHVKSLKAPPPKYTRASFVLSGGRRLCFKDARKFGRFWLVDDPAEVTGELGPEPLETGFDSREFSKKLRAKSGRIKPLLLNQRFIAGVGNIYADESLWRAGIHPKRRAGSLSLKEMKALYAALRRVLRRAIRDQGTDIGDEVVRGDYEPLVYGRKGEPCGRCREKIVRLLVGRRGTYVCPRCQKRKSTGRRS